MAEVLRAIFARPSSSRSGSEPEQVVLKGITVAPKHGARVRVMACAPARARCRTRARIVRTPTISARQTRWSRKIARASPLWTASGSRRAPSRRALGTVLNFGDADRATGRTSENTATQSSTSSLAVARPAPPASPPSPRRPRDSSGAPPSSPGGSRRRSRQGPPQAGGRSGGVGPDLRIEDQVEPEHREQEPGAGGHERGHDASISADEGTMNAPSRVRAPFTRLSCGREINAPEDRERERT